MAGTYRITLVNRIARAIIRPIIRTVFHILSRVQITGVEYVPKKGPYIIAINHVSLYEPPFLLAFWPIIPEAAGAVDIWSRPGQATLARLYGGIPVHRGQYDRQLVEKMLNVLRSGFPLAIAPEGGRSHQPGMRRGLPGIAHLIDQARVPVIPVGIVGATDDYIKHALRFERPLLEMRIGKSILLPPIEGKGETRRVARQRNTDLVMLEIAKLLPDEYRGVYGNGFHLGEATPYRLVEEA